MTKVTTTSIFDRTRLDRLEGEILARVSDLELDGFDNMEVARALWAAASIRAHREGASIRESFHQHVRDASERYLSGMNQLTRDLSREYVKRQIN